MVRLPVEVSVSRRRRAGSASTFPSPIAVEACQGTPAARPASPSCRSGPTPDEGQASGEGRRATMKPARRAASPAVGDGQRFEGRGARGHGVAS
jgi:hypothetical protein